MKRCIAVILLMILCLTMAAPGVSYAATIKLSQTNLELKMGETFTLILSGATTAVKWSSSDTNVATVQEGVVTAVNAGSAVISAKYKDKQYKCILTVKEPTILITVPSMLLDENLATFVSELVFEDESVNEREYTVTYTMTVTQQQSILGYIQECINKDISAGEYPGYTSVTLAYDGSVIDIYVNMNEFLNSDDEDDSILAFLLYSTYYQAFSGISEDEMELDVHIYDNVTNELIYSYNSKDEYEGIDSRLGE